MPTLQQLQEKRNQLAAQVKDLAKDSEKWTAEQRAQWEQVNKDYDAVVAEQKTEKERQESAAAIRARLEAIEKQDRESTNDKGIGLDGDERRRRDPERRLEAEVHGDLRGIALQAYLRRKPLSAEQRSAFSAIGVATQPEGGIDIPYDSLRFGPPAWMAGERQGIREVRTGLDVATSGAGKETIPAGFMAELERKMLYFGGARQVARVIQTASGNSLPWPTVDDTSNTGALLAEATTISTSVDPTFAAVTLGAYKFSSKPIIISAELLEDSAFNLASEIVSLLAERHGRVMNTYTTTGTGSSQPQGLIAASTGKTAASATAFTADELIDLIHSVDVAYRMGGSCGFMMHDTILSYVRKFKDGNGQYLWQPGLQAGIPDRLASYPMTINNDMDSALTTGKKLVLFGDFSKFIIRDAGAIRFYRLDELYRGTDQTGFVGFRRMDSKILQTAAFKKLVLA